MGNTVKLTLETQDVDLILDLLTRKIEKANEKEITEDQLVYKRTLETLKSEILNQIS